MVNHADDDGASDGIDRNAIVRRLRRMADEIESGTTTETPSTRLRATARALYRERRRRASSFRDAGSLFAEPAWDMLLDLYGRSGGGVGTAVSSLCIAADVPSTTALRWIGTLQDRGLVTRTDDPDDGRRSLVRLTDEGTIRMEKHLREFVVADREMKVLIGP